MLHLLQRLFAFSVLEGVIDFLPGRFTKGSWGGASLVGVWSTTTGARLGGTQQKIVKLS